MRRHQELENAASDDSQAYSQLSEDATLQNILDLSHW